MWEGGGGQDRVEGGKWDNCNSIINKYINFKKTRWLQRGPFQDTSSLKCQKLKIKTESLKAAREKQLVTYREIPIRLSAKFSK